MNACIVHDDNRIWQRERVHDVQKSVDETIEFPGCKWMVFNGEVQDSVERKCGKYGIARRPSEQGLEGRMAVMNVPCSPNEEVSPA